MENKGFSGERKSQGTSSISVQVDLGDDDDYIVRYTKPPGGLRPDVDGIQNGSFQHLEPPPAYDDPAHTDGQTVGATEPEKVEKVVDDPWALPELKYTGKPWSELTGSQKAWRVIRDGVIKVALLLGLLYLFICSLDFLSSAFRLLGGKTAGEAIGSSIVATNPICGLMVGVLATVLVQSSSTTTSIVVSMVASGILQVRPAIPIIMGANIGTSVTNTIVALFQAGDRQEFRRAFAGATVHDMFNWLSVIVLLPVEIISGYLFRLTKAITDSLHLQSNEDVDVELLKVITKPFTSLIIQVDKKVITKIAEGDESALSKSLVKHYCETVDDVTTFLDNVTELVNTTSAPGEPLELKNMTLLKNMTKTETVPVEACHFLFYDLKWKYNWTDSQLGVLILILALLILCICLVCIVKLLHSLLKGQIAVITKKVINSDFPGRLSFLSGYVAILVGAGLTMVLQSSSIFTSAMTPLVGVGVVTVERMYPFTLGANIGTTFTAILAALASSGGKLRAALQIAFCHLFFNITGIVIWYPIPHMRKVPIYLAKVNGNTTAKYRWFAIFYLFIMFFIFPAAIFGLSVAGWPYLGAVGILFLLVFIFIIVVNVLQRKRPRILPEKLRNWNFLPLWLHSLEPMDRVITTVLGLRFCQKYCACQKCKSDDDALVQQNHTENGGIDLHSRTSVAKNEN
ncbi:sodium-dependent phosphate transport protein 2B-like [Ptychodera flava]|uniref:sodium-dependent phosphate transport protein 2B-like n=1 Tax=Ptychodera flava TaxID=63121 RepID=UPI00396A9565